jgi:hypothetical protein
MASSDLLTFNSEVFLRIMCLCHIVVVEKDLDKKKDVGMESEIESKAGSQHVLLRSPPELGNLPILFCKGADSAMLDPSICSSSKTVQQVKKGSMDGELDDDVDGMGDYDQWEFAEMLGLQAQFGDFAPEGLGSLVLGFRMLSDAECDDWLLRLKQPMWL